MFHYLFCVPVVRYVCTLRKNVQLSISEQIRMYIRTYVFVCIFVLYSIDVDSAVQDVDFLFTVIALLFTKYFLYLLNIVF